MAITVEYQAKQAHDVETMSYQAHDVKATSYQHQYKVMTMLF